MEPSSREPLGDVAVVIGSPFELRLDGSICILDEPGELGPLLAQYPDTLTTAGVDADGTLELTFGRGWTIRIPPDRAFEAWLIRGPGRNLVVCPPGAKTVAVWSDDD